MPAGVAALERLGLDATQGEPFHGIRYHFRGRIAEGRFPEVKGLPRSGRGFRRRHLDHALFELAARTPNVQVHTGALVEAPQVEGGRVVGLIVNGASRSGDLVIGADGAQSRLRHALKLDLPSRRKRVGVCAHFRLAPGSATPQSVDVYLGRNCELYTAPLPHRELLVAALVNAQELDGTLEDQFWRWCSSQPHLAARLEGAERTSELLAISPVSGRARQRILPGFVLLGDAAGFSDPITGGGMTQALLAAELLALYVARRPFAIDDWLAEFDREREARLRDFRRLTALLLWLAENRGFLWMALKAMRKLPRLFSHLLGVAGGARRLWNAEVNFGIPALSPSRNLCSVLVPHNGDRPA